MHKFSCNYLTLAITDGVRSVTAALAISRSIICPKIANKELIPSSGAWGPKCLSRTSESILLYNAIIFANQGFWYLYCKLSDLLAKIICEVEMFLVDSLVEDLGATVQRVIFDIRSLTPEFGTLPDNGDTSVIRQSCLLS